MCWVPCCLFHHCGAGPGGLSAARWHDAAAIRGLRSSSILRPTSGTNCRKERSRTSARARNVRERAIGCYPCPVPWAVLASPPTAVARSHSGGGRFHDGNQWRPWAAAATAADRAATERTRPVHQGFLVRESQRPALASAERNAALDQHPDQCRR